MGRNDWPRGVCFLTSFNSVFLIGCINRPSAGITDYLFGNCLHDSLKCSQFLAFVVHFPKKTKVLAFYNFNSGC